MAKLELLVDEVPKMTIHSIKTRLSLRERPSVQRHADCWAPLGAGRDPRPRCHCKAGTGNGDAGGRADRDSAEGQHSVMILAGRSPCLLVLKRVLQAAPALPREGDFCRRGAVSLAKREIPGLPSAETRRCQSVTKTPKPEIYFSFLILLCACM